MPQRLVLSCPARSTVSGSIFGNCFHFPLGFLSHGISYVLRMSKHQKPVKVSGGWVQGFPGSVCGRKSRLSAGVELHNLFSDFLFLILLGSLYLSSFLFLHDRPLQCCYFSLVISSRSCGTKWGLSVLKCSDVGHLVLPYG